jgi:hypothetical protein
MAADQSELAALRLNDADFDKGKNIPYPYGPDSPMETNDYCDDKALVQQDMDPFPSLHSCGFPGFQGL